MGFSVGFLSGAVLRDMAGAVLDCRAEEDAFLLEGILLVGTNSLASGLKDVGLPVAFAPISVEERALLLRTRRLLRGEFGLRGMSSSIELSISLMVGKKSDPNGGGLSAMWHD